MKELPSIAHATWPMLVLMVAMSGIVFYFIFSARKGKDLYVRRIPGIDAIDEAIGRATEMGRPISFVPGLGGIDIPTLAAISICGHIAKVSAQYDTRLIATTANPLLLPVMVEVCKESYRSAGKMDLFDPNMVQYLSSEQFAYASGVMGIMHRERVSANFMFGVFAAESLIIAEAGQQVGAVQVAGTISYNQIPFFITTCDYTIIGEELYATSAYLTREPTQLGSLIGQDVVKVLFAIIIVIGLFVGVYSSTKWLNNPISLFLYQESE